MEKELSCGTLSSQKGLDKNYWNKKWQDHETGWDIGYSSPAIEKYLQQYENKEARILIPGCGNAYEAESLLNLGFQNIAILDFASNAVKILEEKFKKNKEISVICDDFFQHTGNYDLIIEQTFFCAIPPLRRNEYAAKMRQLLYENGRVIGVLFNRNFEKIGPPFGGSIPEYQSVFNKYFTIEKMEKCANSIEARQGSEIFINLKKKNHESKYG